MLEHVLGSVLCRSESETAQLAGALAAAIHPGDVIGLTGALGVGKTAFARGFVRALTGDETDVPSPTFTLVQTYTTPKGEVWHCDLYRLQRPDDALELGLEDAFSDAVTLIEWPERLGAALPARHLLIHLEPLSHDPSARRVTFTGDASWAQRLRQANILRPE